MLVAYAFELIFITIFYISQLTGRGTDDEAYNDVIHRCLCHPVTAHEKCAGGGGKCACSAVMVHSECCDAFLKKSSMGGWLRGGHKRALKETTPSFLDAAIFFAISIGIGAVGTSSSEGFTGYEADILRYAFLLTCSPLYIVLALSSKTLRRKRLRRNLISLVVVLFFLGVLMVPKFSTHGVVGGRWDTICFSYNYGSNMSRGGVSYYILYFALVFECLRLREWCFRKFCQYLQNWEALTKRFPEGLWGHCRCPKCALGFGGHCNSPRCAALGCWERSIYRWTSGKGAAWLAATICISVAWFGGVSLAKERAAMQGLAGKDYLESKMTYGQYLAMVIFVPVLVEYAYVAICKRTTSLPYI